MILAASTLPKTPPPAYGNPCLLDDDFGVGEESRLIRENCKISIGHFGVPISMLWEDPVEKFYMYKFQWEEETAFLSSTTEIAMHSAYQKIIGLGEKALPLILSELKKNPNHWFWALKSITDEDPVIPEHRGRIKMMTEDWLNWGRGKGYNV